MQRLGVAVRNGRQDASNVGLHVYAMQGTHLKLQPKRKDRSGRCVSRVRCV